MASTNSTTHYELSQYIGTDKPTYLTDYNQDMSKIDAGIYAAKSEADTNSNAIVTLSSLTTTTKTNVVAAINEVNSETSSIGDVSTLTTTDKTTVVAAVNEVNSKTSGIGTLANLTTTEKTTLVGAINEVDGDIGVLTNLTTTAKTNVVSAVNEVNGNVGNLSNLDTTAKTSVVAAVNEIKSFSDYMTLTDFRKLSGGTSSGTISDNLSVALNSDGTAGKIYGALTVTNPNSNEYITYTNTGIMGVTESFDIVPAGIVQSSQDQGLKAATLRISPPQGSETSARIQLRVGSYGNYTFSVYILPCFYFFKNFGDTE